VVLVVVVVAVMKYCIVRPEKCFAAYSFFKKYESEDERSRLNFSKYQVLIAEAYGIHKSSVSWICRDTKKSSTQEDPVFVSFSKKIKMQKR
jgi:hypothetical protein